MALQQLLISTVGMSEYLPQASYNGRINMFKKLLNRLFTPVTGTNYEEFEQKLEEMGCYISQFSTFLVNGSQTVIVYSDTAQWLEFMEGYCASYTNVLVFKQSAGNGQFYYWTLNNWIGTRVKI